MAKTMMVLRSQRVREWTWKWARQGSNLGPTDYETRAGEAQMREEATSSFDRVGVIPCFQPINVASPGNETGTETWPPREGRSIENPSR
jgi:hypothetical protein